MNSSENLILNGLEKLKKHYKFSMLYLGIIQDKNDSVAYLENGFSESNYFKGNSKEEALSKLNANIALNFYLNKPIL